MSQHTPVDPTLCAAEPAPDRLDDGFSPPADAVRDDSAQASAEAPPQPALGNKSPF
jgi:hypothetical protein